MNQMKTNSWVLLAVLAAATCLDAVTAAAAPPVFQGGFNLPMEVRWGKAVLPPGDYLLRVEYSGPVTLVTIGEAKNRKTVAFVVSLTSEKNNDRKQESALLLGTREGRATVHSLRLAGLDVVLLFDPALAHGRVEEAGKFQAVPIVAVNLSFSSSPALQGTNPYKKTHKTKQNGKGESHEDNA